MPIYEFTCKDCHKTFELSRPVSEATDRSTPCPHCGSQKTERVWSTSSPSPARRADPFLFRRLQAKAPRAQSLNLEWGENRFGLCAEGH
jgi:putative FmdB family regulatory protein